VAVPGKFRPWILRIGRRVRTHRIALHMRQSDLELASGVSRKFIGEFERGQVNCSLVTLKMIADALGCTLTQLLENEPTAGYVVLTAENMHRVRQALVAIDIAITPRVQLQRYTRFDSTRNQTRRSRFAHLPERKSAS
jgi:transcriptional regulator with XRE-family HTH domain